MTLTTRPDGNINCPVHGTHGALSHGQCWYCAQSNPVKVIPGRPIPVPETKNAVVLAYKEKK